MWTLIVRVSGKEPIEYILKPGQTTLGRKLENDIVVADTSASRLHAEIFYDDEIDSATLSDMGSTNGTFVNRERVSVARRLFDNDVIRIGGSTIDVTHHATGEKPQGLSGSHRYTRELVLESLDHHAVLMYEVARQLNTVMDIETALDEVSGLMRRAMGADRCEVILAEEFDKLADLNFPTTIAESAINQKSAVVIPDMAASALGKSSGSSILMRIRSALCVPVMTGDEVLALIYMYKVDVGERPFTQKDLQLAVAISHQAALTIQRMQLLEKIKKEQQGRLLLERFLSPTEAEYMLEEYMEMGQLPGLRELEVTILFADLADSVKMAEQVGAKRFGDVLNRYYWDVTDTVFGYGGLVKYLGDGIMAVFGMTGKRADDPLRAVQAGLSILEHLKTVDYGIEIEMGIGVNTGLAVLGYVGTQQRVELAALGDVVNVAFRLQHMARPNRLLVGPETAVGVAGKLPLSDMGMQEIKGRTQPLRIYEVLSKENATS
jgi:adenylate cyclase